ncbi:unnamed protein product [Protopolystoma xenopodis]|uniref:Uncharacterized protein n=1 Tax=Protopolystoma xenopodis TaxID=117903 RepID=A0A448WB62_9PLAT|nr:unnamed protein product [Protopolystoma xenopodis]
MPELLRVVSVCRFVVQTNRCDALNKRHSAIQPLVETQSSVVNAERQIRASIRVSTLKLCSSLGHICICTEMACPRVASQECHPVGISRPVWTNRHYTICQRIDIALNSPWPVSSVALWGLKKNVFLHTTGAHSQAQSHTSKPLSLGKIV